MFSCCCAVAIFCLSFATLNALFALFLATFKAFMCDCCGDMLFTASLTCVGVLTRLEKPYKYWSIKRACIRLSANTTVLTSRPLIRTLAINLYTHVFIETYAKH